jgi:hypothetical protein
MQRRPGTKFTINVHYKPHKIYSNAVKIKAIPLQTWTGPEVSRTLRFPDFKIIGTRRW